MCYHSLGAFALVGGEWCGNLLRGSRFFVIISTDNGKMALTIKKPCVMIVTVRVGSDNTGYVKSDQPETSTRNEVGHVRADR